MDRRRSTELIIFVIIFLFYGGFVIKTRSHPVDLGRIKRDDSSSSGPAKYLLISEFNLLSSDDNSATPKFVEIVQFTNPLKERQERRNDRELDGYMLIIIQGHPSQIVISIDLGKVLATTGRDYILIGSEDLPEVDVILSSVQCVYKNPSIFPSMDDTPFAIVILYLEAPGDKELLSLEASSTGYIPNSLQGYDNVLKRAIIRENSVDMVVTGSRAPYSHCFFFDSIFPSMSFSNGHKYLLRDFATRQDYSLNRCCEDQVPFAPFCFNLGRPTPGKKNDCTGKPFVLEREIQRGHIKIGNGAPKGHTFEFEDSDIQSNAVGCAASFPGMPTNNYETLNYSYIVAVVEETMDTTDCSRNEEEQISWQDVQRNYSKITISTLPQFHEFNQEDFNACRPYLSQPDKLLVPSIKVWLEMIRNPGECKFFCKVCREYLRLGYRPDFKRKSNLQKDKGYYSKDADTNSDVIKRHAQNDFHKEALKYYRQIKAATSASEINEINQRQVEIEKSILKPTMNAVHIAYLQLRTNGAFRSNPVFMNGIAQLGVDIGFKHRNAGALKSIMSSISTEMHVTLLRHLVHHGTYFTLIVDGTTNAAISYLVCLIQTLEENNPVVYLWALIPLSKSGGSQKMVEDVVRRIEEDDSKVPGFANFFRSKIIALSSDSASEMVGIHNSFYTHIQSYAGRSITSIKCGSHKLHRVLFHAIDIVTKPSADPKKKGETYFESFGRSTNQFYTFYLSRGSKRWQRITELGRDLGVIPYRLKKFFDLRWASSELKCLEALYHDYDLLREDLESIKTDTSFNTDGCRKASELANKLEDKTFAVTVVEFIDMLTVLKTMSVRFQKKAGLMIGNVEIVRQGFAELSNLRVTPGDQLAKFLESCECENLCSQGNCNLTHYDNCEFIVRNGKGLKVTELHGVKLSDFRDLIYYKLLEGMEDYFSPIILEAFDLFNNKLFNFECNYTGRGIAPVCLELDDCYTNMLSINPDRSAETPQKKLKRLCSFYFYSDEECKNLYEDWKFALSGIVANPECRKRRYLDAGVFWPDTLTRDEIPITAPLHDFIVKVLVSGWTSADAERAFSVVTHIKSPDRSSMHSETLEQLLRLKFNGPDTLSTDANYRYTRAFVTRFSRVDDADTKGGRHPIADDSLDSFYFTQSKLF